MFHHNDLVVNANGGLAKNSLAELLKLSANRTGHRLMTPARTYNREDAAASPLSNGSADGAEAGRRDGNARGCRHRQSSLKLGRRV